MIYLISDCKELLVPSSQPAAARNTTGSFDLVTCEHPYFDPSVLQLFQSLFAVVLEGVFDTCDAHKSQPFFQNMPQLLFTHPPFFPRIYPLLDLIHRRKLPHSIDQRSESLFSHFQRNFVDLSCVFNIL